MGRHSSILMFGVAGIAFLLANGCAKVMATPTVVRDEIHCTAPFRQVGSRCLLVDNTILGAWYETRQFCKDLAGDLVNMHDANLLYDVAVYLKENDITKQSFWIGAYDLLDEGHWVWSWNNTDTQMNTPLWGVTNGRQEPDGFTRQNCAMLNKDYYYFVFDEDCEQSHSVICAARDGTTPRSAQLSDDLEELSEDCPPPYQIIGGLCLLVEGILGHPFYQQQQLCQAIGGHLAKIEDANVLGELFHYLDRNGVDIDLFLGGNDLEEEGTWVWHDGTSVPMGTPFWGEEIEGSQEPAGDDRENCLGLSKDDFFFFHDMVCDEPKGFVCQYNSAFNETLIWIDESDEW